jgi:hypothetical protein
MQSVPDHGPDDPKAERAHCETFEHGSSGAIAERHSDHQKAYEKFAASPRKSSASACSDADPAADPAPISTRNIAAFI